MPSTLVSLKSYGDFVIAARARKNLSPNHDITIVAGEHLRALAQATGITDKIYFIGDSSYVDTPAAFDIRKKGKLAAAKSLIDLRRRLKLGCPNTPLIFDHLGWREKFLAGKFSHLELPKSKNIYNSYAEIFKILNQPFVQKNIPPPQKSSTGKLLIIPNSRIQNKTIPTSIINETHLRLKEKEISAEVILLEGEQISESLKIKKRIIPRNFNSIANEISQANAIISADSLAAHLGNFYEKKTFVFTPVPNEYWLPSQAFQDASWACFDNTQAFPAWLDRLAA